MTITANTRPTRPPRWRTPLIALTLAATMVKAAAAQEPVLDEFEQEFMKGFEEISEIATKTKLNIDDMPAIVTILRREDLESLGMDNLYEALGLIPGVELGMEPSSAKLTMFRGAREKGKIKLLLDGMSVNNTFRGSIYHYFNFPLEAIERIEVIRGPGSVLYGTGAFTGVINVITKNNSGSQPKNSFSSSYGTYDQMKNGFSLSGEKGNLRWSADGYFQSEDKHLDVGTDGADPALSNAPGESQEDMKDSSIGLAVNYGKWQLHGRVKTSQDGIAFGATNMLESDDNLKGITNRATLVEAVYKGETDAAHSYTFTAGLNKYVFDMVYRRTPSVNDYNDTVQRGYIDEETYYGELVYQLQLGDHQLVTGLYTAFSRNLESWQSRYGELDPMIKSPYIDEEADRTVYAGYIQDTWTAGENTTVVVGARYDDYSDFGSAFTPRLAAIHETGEKTNVKLMYGRAFRAPSWTEIGGTIKGFSEGSSSLDPETIDTYEASFIYKESVHHLLRFNAFHSEIKDIIYRVDAQYRNVGENKMSGLEMEYKKRLSLKDEMYANFSYLVAEDEEGEELPDIANMMAKAYYRHLFGNGLTSTTLVNLIGPRKRAADDTRDDLAGYATVNQTLFYRFEQGITASFAIKNLFNANVKFPSYPIGTAVYEHDYPREGRNFRLTLAMDF